MSPQVFFAISIHVTDSVTYNPPSLILSSSYIPLPSLKLFSLLNDFCLAIWKLPSTICSLEYDIVQALLTFLKLWNRFLTSVLSTWNTIYVLNPCQTSSIPLEIFSVFHFLLYIFHILSWHIKPPPKYYPYLIGLIFLALSSHWLVTYRWLKMLPLKTDICTGRGGTCL